MTAASDVLRVGGAGARAAATTMRVHAATIDRGDVMVLDLRPVSADAVAEFTAGSHVDLHLPDGSTRPYSLVNAPDDRSRYVLGVKLESNGRGGSRWFHESLRVGDDVLVGRAVNSFPLDETASRSVFIGGGIGITPLLSMVGRAAAIAMPWQLTYAVRDRAVMPFEQHVHSFGSRCRLHVDAEHDGRPLDIAAVLADVAPDTHVYCCGPRPMLAAFSAAVAGRDRAYVHTESFDPVGAAPDARGFVVRLARSMREVTVAPGQTILDALRVAGVEVPSSCEQGRCGTCEVAVVEGRPDHRDAFLSADERRAGRTMMPCCSGSLDDELTLDL